MSCRSFPTPLPTTTPCFDVSAVPPDFQPLATGSPFNQAVGPFHCALRGDHLIIGLLIEQKHCNSAGNLHGGMVSSIADVALGHNIGLAMGRQAGAEIRSLSSGTPRAPIATVSMSTDFAGTARLGDWVEAHVDVQRTGRSLAFANAYLVRGEQRIARISAVFRILADPA